MTTTQHDRQFAGREFSIGSRTVGGWFLLWIIVSAIILVIRAFCCASLIGVQSFASRGRTYTSHGERLIQRLLISRLSHHTSKTQAALITTDRVLTTALSSPEIKNCAFITESDDSRADLRKKLVVEILPDAYLIRVALALPNGKEAAAIVNSVVSSYLAYNGDFKAGREP